MESFRIGVLWGTHVVRLSCFRSSGSRSTLLHLARLNVDSSNINAVSEAVRAWSVKHIPDGSDVSAVVTVSEGSLFVKELDIPRGSRKEVTQAIRWDLQTKNAAFPKDSVLSWQYKNNDPASGKAVAFALRETESDLIRDVFTGLGWTVTAIESYTASLTRLQRLPTAPILSVDFAGNQASVAIVEANTARFATLVDLSQAVASGQAGTLTQTALTGLVSQVRQALSYWQTRGNKPVAALVVTGDEAESAHVKKHLAKPLDLEMLAPSPATVKRISLGKVSSHVIREYALPVGAMLRMTDFTYDGDIDFLTPEARSVIASTVSSRQFGEAARQLTAASLALALAGVGVIAANMLLSGKYTKEIDQNARFIQNHPAQKLLPAVTDANSFAGSVLSLMGKQSDTGSRLAYFADHTPSGITYTAVKYAGEPKQEWVIEGTGSREAILAFYYELKQTATGATVTMPYSSLSRETDSVFSIRIIW